MSNNNRNSKYNYGMDYIGDTPQDPMDVVIATALRQTGEEWRRRNGTADHIVDHVTVGSLGAGIRAFIPNDPGVVAVSLDLEDDDEFYDILPPRKQRRWIRSAILIRLVASIATRVLASSTGRTTLSILNVVYTTT
jgi:hypothetical protein